MTQERRTAVCRTCGQAWASVVVDGRLEACASCHYAKWRWAQACAEQDREMSARSRTSRLKAKGEGRAKGETVEMSKENS
jgi:hypothetical protein